jgi:Phage integrase family
MVPDVASALARLADREFWIGPEDLVFANELGTFQDASAIRIRYRAALTRAGLRQLRFHGLRHTFGTFAVRRAEVPVVQAWMGHSDIQTTMRYVHRRDRGDEAKPWPGLFGRRGRLGTFPRKRLQTSHAEVRWGYPVSPTVLWVRNGLELPAQWCVQSVPAEDAWRGGSVSGQL